MVTLKSAERLCAFCQGFDWDKSNEIFQQATPPATAPEIPAVKTKANSKTAPEGKFAAVATPTAGSSTATAKPGKAQAPAQTSSPESAFVTLSGFDSSAHAAVVFAFEKACDESHGQINAAASMLKVKFEEVSLEEQANAARWQDCLKWMNVPFA